MATRAEFNERLHAEHRRWRDLVAAVGPDRSEEPGAMGDWSFRDVAGHLAGWRERTIGRLEAAARGEPEPAPPWPAELDDDDPINAWIRDRDQDRSTDELLAAYDGSFARLGAAVAALPDAVLTDPAAFPWLGGVSMLEADPFEHLRDEHEPGVRAWLASGGRPGS